MCESKKRKREEIGGACVTRGLCVGCCQCVTGRCGTHNWVVVVAVVAVPGQVVSGLNHVEGAA